MAQVQMTWWIDDTELWSRIWGGGWESFGSWWISQRDEDGTDWDKPGVTWLTIEGDDGKPVKGRIDMAALVKAVENCPPHIQSSIMDDNVDAIVSDYVLQVAVLGECIYG